MKLAWIVTAVQVALAARVISRLVATANGSTIKRVAAIDSSPDSVTVLLPVLNEKDNLGACLKSLVRDPTSVSRILVIDGGSTDGTRNILDDWSEKHAKIEAVPFHKPTPGRNSKALQLQAGLDRASSEWILTIDADVRIEPDLVSSLLAHAQTDGLSALSVATKQIVHDPGVGFIHPSLLTSLVYRFGIPGQVARAPANVQANGQCFLARKTELDAVGGFAAAADSICEDVTVARLLVSHGYQVAFAEAGDLVATEMYGSFDDALNGWSRSLPMRDRFSGTDLWFGLAEVALVQALPGLRVLGGLITGKRGPSFAINRGLVAMRLGILAGTARAYPNRPWTYWISPLADSLTAFALVRSTLRRKHSWRGRIITTGDH